MIQQLPVEILVLIVGKLEEKKIFRFDLFAKETWASLQLASRTLCETATSLLLKHLSVEVDALGKVEELSERGGHQLLKHTKQLQLVLGERLKSLCSSLESAIDKFDVNGRLAQLQLELFKFCLLTKGSQIFGYGESQK